MDKIAANNHIVLLRKEVKKAKSMVAGNLIRKIEKLKKEKEKVSGDEEKQKIQSRIERILAETKAIKSLDSYPICRQATLKPDVKYWTDIVGNPKSSAEERLSARIICKNNIQKRVAKFIADNRDCLEWLEEYFEFREKKQDLKASMGKS